MSNNIQEDMTGAKVVEMDTLQVLKLALDLGGEAAETIANASNEEINQLMSEVDKVRIIV